MNDYFFLFIQVCFTHKYTYGPNYINTPELFDIGCTNQKVNISNDLIFFQNIIRLTQVLHLCNGNSV